MIFTYVYKSILLYTWVDEYLHCLPCAPPLQNFKESLKNLFVTNRQIFSFKSRGLTEASYQLF